VPSVQACILGITLIASADKTTGTGTIYLCTVQPVCTHLITRKCEIKRFLNLTDKFWQSSLPFLTNKKRTVVWYSVDGPEENLVSQAKKKMTSGMECLRKGAI
jgi:hypothetical protein